MTKKVLWFAETENLINKFDFSMFFTPICIPLPFCSKFFYFIIFFYIDVW
jgi:hypothetical protein